MKQLGLVVAGLALVFVLNIVVALNRPHIVRTEHISSAETIVSKP